MSTGHRKSLPGVSGFSLSLHVHLMGANCSRIAVQLYHTFAPDPITDEITHLIGIREVQSRDSTFGVEAAAKGGAHSCVSHLCSMRYRSNGSNASSESDIGFVPLDMQSLNAEEIAVFADATSMEL